MSLYFFELKKFNDLVIFKTLKIQGIYLVFRAKFLELSVEILHGFMSQRDLFISGVFWCYSTFGGMIYTQIHASQMCFDPKMTKNQPKSMDLVDFEVF